MSIEATDPLIARIAEHFQVSPEKIRLRLGGTPDTITIEGPKPARPARPDIPNVRTYCFTETLRLPPFNAMCQAYREEYASLQAALEQLIADEAWVEVAAVASRLAELSRSIDGCDEERTRVVRYCVFPDEWFEDPLADYGLVPERPPVPPL